jgi:hypothetical protein
MNSLRVRALVLFGLTALSGFGQAFNFNNPERMIDSLDHAVGLTDEQKIQATAIITRAITELAAIPEAERLRDPGLIRPQMRAGIRAILTPAQQKKYDRTPQLDGGGLTLQTPENKMARLHALVTLTAAQKIQALEVFTKELDALLDLPEAERAAGGAAARQTTRAEIRAILNPAQQAQYDAAPQTRGGGKMGRD